MSKLLTEEQLELRAMVAEFGEKEVAPVAEEADRSHELPMELYKKAFDMGLHVLGVPEELGGSGLDTETICIILEELSKYDAGFTVGVAANELAAKPVFIGGTPEQKKLFADAIVDGNFAAFCLTEPDAGSDAGAVRTTAVREGDEYVINGAKCFITNGGVASIYSVFASTDRSKGLKGLSCFIVPRDLPGVSVGKEEDKMGIRASNTTEVIFENVRVPASYLVGKEGEGFKLAMKTLDASRPMVGAQAVGICQRALDECVEYAKVRKTFGQPIAKLQAIQFMIADMEIATSTAREYCRYAARLVDAGLPHSKEAAIAKCYAGDSAMKVSTDAVQVLAGYGYSREYPVEKLMRDAKIFQIFEGTNQIQRVVISANLLR